MNNMQSIYCYPNTDVLINHFNIKDQDKLSQLELEVTSAKVFQLKDNPIRGNWDLKHLQEIHKYIFGDIYPFAGEIRNEQIAKGYFQFCSPMFIEDMGKDIFNELKSENFLKGLDKQNM